MKWLVFAACLALILTGSSCRTSDLRTFEIQVPEMKNAACARIVGAALGRQSGVVANGITVNLAKKTVTVRYDSMLTARKNLEFAIAEAGFKANDVPAQSSAAKALPPECL